MQQARLIAKCYCWQTDDKTPYFHLAPGEPIKALEFDIGNHPLRVMVLSPSYFTSQYCLKELCLSLCSLQNQIKLPVIILTGFATGEKVFSQQQFEFADATQVDVTKRQTLLQALQATHKALAEKFTHWRGFDFSPLCRAKFAQILEVYHNLS